MITGAWKSSDTKFEFAEDASIDIDAPSCSFVAASACEIEENGVISKAAARDTDRMDDFVVVFKFITPLIVV
jgi:hypothetical protein